MDALRGWATALCFAAVAAGMAGILAPQGNLEKVYKFVISLFFLACVLMPLFSMKNLDLDRLTRSVEAAAAVSSVSGGSLAQTIGKQEMDEAAQNVASLVRQSCQASGAQPQSVSVRVARTADGYRVTACRITFPKEEAGKANAAAAAVKKDLGIDATVGSTKEE